MVMVVAGWWWLLLLLLLLSAPPSVLMSGDKGTVGAANEDGHEGEVGDDDAWTGDASFAAAVPGASLLVEVTIEGSVDVNATPSLCTAPAAVAPVNSTAGASFFRAPPPPPTRKAATSFAFSAATRRRST
jgi:hypothetical protein